MLSKDSNKTHLYQAVYRHILTFNLRDLLIYYMFTYTINSRSFKYSDEQLEHAVDGAPSQIPSLKFLTPPAPRSPTPGHDLATEWKFCSICFLSFICESTHKVRYKDLWNWHFNDIWPCPKVTSLTLGWNCYLHFILLVIPVDLICYMTMFKKKIVWPPGYPQCPKVPPLGHDSGDRIKIPMICFVSFICENTHKIWFKNLWNWHGNQNLMVYIWPLTSPQGH